MANMDFMFDWEAEGDRFSFEDSDRFDEDSICSWISEPESLCNNWRGWKKQNGGTVTQVASTSNKDGLTSLVELASQTVACHIPFEVIEHFYPPVPEHLQLRIAFLSFPELEEDIRLYSCLANGSADEFQKGEHLFKAKAVKDALQIGFHLSATVIPPQTVAQPKGNFNVAVVFDKRKISSCSCTCNSTASWCAHVVALCLFRIHQAPNVILRAPVSESLSRLHRDQLQKFAQYLITELPQQILPTAQRLLDELLSSQQSAINTVCGAPDPTAGPSASEHTKWCLDEANMHENIKRTLVKFSQPTAMVYSDVNFLSSTAPPAAAEWQSLLRPLRGREPEGMWNLLSIVREMFRRHDSNAVPLLEILTEEIMCYDTILSWWFTTKVTTSHNNQGMSNRGNNSVQAASQHAAMSLCDEVVALWRLAALNPALSPIQRDDLVTQLKDWHIKTIDKVRNFRNSHVGNQAGQPIKKQDIEVFVGFKPSIEACYLDWGDYPITGVTYVDKYKKKLVADHHKVGTLSTAFQNMDKHRNLSGSVHKQKTVPHPQVVVIDPQNDGGCSSSSEGFCENERPEAAFSRDSDSSFTEEDGLSRSKASKQSASETVSKLKLKDRTIPVGVSISDQEPSGACAKAGEEADSDSSVPGAAMGYNKAISALKAEKWQESTNSSDEYQVYFYDTKAKLGDLAAEKKKKDEPNYLAGLKKIELKQDILFARAEALHAHGHTKEACKLAKQLAEEMLSNPPDLSNEPLNNTASKKKKAQHTVSSQAISTLSKSSFLCSVLSEDTECHHLAFKVGMFGLEMPRPPASSKGLEVKLANQEQELVILLKKIPLGPSELNVLRDRAEQLRDGKLRSRGEALLPLVLASFVFDSLCQPAQPVYGTANRPPSRSVGRQHLDDLGFHAAVAALGLKANVSEAEHPLLCEGTRRQRGDLAIAMLVHYKDDQIKLQKIMEKLLDKDVHQLYKGPTLNSYLPSGKTGAASQVKHTDKTASTGAEGVRQNNVAATQAVPSHNACGAENGAAAVPSTSSQADNWQERGRDNLDYLNLEQKFMTMHLNNLAAGSASARPKTSLVNKYQTNKDTDSSAVEEECDGSEYKAWEEKFRCTNLKTFKKHSVGMASIDSSAPETTSSDNSPTLVRRNWAKHQGPGSDSGSSGKSSDSIGSSSSDNKRAKAAAICRDNESPPGPYQGLRYPIDSRSSTPNMKLGRYKGKNRAMPTIPNQPSEASAHFMFELAKTVLGKAGGNSATSLFTQATTNNNHSGPHRQLHLCAFQIGLYALGLHNCVSPNWLSRTYSSHVSWITGQAMEVGAPAIKILIETWEGHLTPPEAAAMADRASRGRDPNMVRAAADLALSCLPHAHALNPNEIQRALIQCREQSREKLEQACLAVESAAKGGGVYPEVLFDVARRWYELYEESVGTASAEPAPVAAAAAASPVLMAVQPQANQQVPPQVAQVPVMQPGPERTSPPMIPVVAIQQVPPATQQHQVGSVAATVSYSIQPQQGVQPQQQVAHHPAYITPYSYVQQIPTFGHQYTQPHIPLNTHNMHPAYVTTHPYPNQTQFNNIAHVQNVHPNTTLYHPNVAHLRGANPQVQLFTNHNGQVSSIPQNGQVVNIAPAMDAATLAGGQAMVMSQVPEQPHPHNSTQMNYLMAAYRVGMLALETLARRVHDDRPQTKFARNPPYGEDVKWLLSIGMKLGISCLQQFCGSITNSVMSPFVIQDIAIEIAHYLARNNPAQVTQQLRSPLLNTLVQKCLQMFIQCAHQRLHHISQAEYDEFVTIICSARNAFCMTPGGMVQFNELLTNLRRSKSCKKDLWQRIVNGLATGGM
ncbi:unnamed protein product [Owenia fusiformis]|uniref:Uncharacterized protein n=1 Tax=Owenia fusiformis TaxID=6347 RepID=A0A8J1U8A0_OWEFU|nr:unnamed protein product [Owenia fusiformis]